MKTRASPVGLTGYVGRLYVRALRSVLHSCLGLLTGLDFTVDEMSVTGILQALYATFSAASAALLVAAYESRRKEWKF